MFPLMVRGHGVGQGPPGIDPKLDARESGFYFSNRPRPAPRPRRLIVPHPPPVALTAHIEAPQRTPRPLRLFYLFPPETGDRGGLLEKRRNPQGLCPPPPSRFGMTFPLGSAALMEAVGASFSNRPAGPPGLGGTPW